MIYKNWYKIDTIWPWPLKVCKMAISNQSVTKKFPTVFYKIQLINVVNYSPLQMQLTFITTEGFIFTQNAQQNPPHI